MKVVKVWKMFLPPRTHPLPPTLALRLFIEGEEEGGQGGQGTLALAAHNLLPLPLLLLLHLLLLLPLPPPSLVVAVVPLVAVAVVLLSE